MQQLGAHVWVLELKGWCSDMQEGDLFRVCILPAGEAEGSGGRRRWWVGARVMRVRSWWVEAHGGETAEDGSGCGSRKGQSKRPIRSCCIAKMNGADQWLTKSIRADTLRSILRWEEAAVRIDRVRIQGYQCLDDVEVVLDDVTRVIGPNGIGKSSILRALDWFFNGGQIDESEISVRADPPRVRVEVVLRDLSDSDRDALGRYAPEHATAVVLWKTWEAGETSFSGNARTYPGFRPIRAAGPALEKRRLYGELRHEDAALELPEAKTAPAVLAAMTAWEAENPGRLEDTEEALATEFFGFLGNAKLSGLFDYVFVSADLRAGEEAEARQGALIGKLLQRSLDQANVLSAIGRLADEFERDQNQIVSEGLDDQLRDVGAALTESVSAFSSGRTIQLIAEAATPRRASLNFHTKVNAGEVQTLVTGQGHGFQRALLLGILKLIAERGQSTNESGTVMLAIEEPELFQHPAQARSFARVLRQLATDLGTGIQVIYATHSSLFIEPGRFSEIRRLHAATTGATDVTSADIKAVEAMLRDTMRPADVRKQVDRVCPQQLSEAVFSDRAILVEGETDKSFFEAILERFRPLALTSNTVVVNVEGKLSLPLADAILRALGIRTLLVADNDSDKRLENVDESTEKERDRQTSAQHSNRKLLAWVAAPVADWPTGLVDTRMLFLEEDLESFLAQQWPEWEAARQDLIASGEGFESKHGPTYANATLDAVGSPPQIVLDAVDQLCANQVAPNPTT